MFRRVRGRLAQVSVLFLALTLPSRESQAIAGIASGNAALIIGGSAAIGLGLVFGTIGARERDRGAMAVAFFLAIAGVVLLDEEEGIPRFQPLEPRAARRLGLSRADADAYNELLPEINLLAESAALEWERGLGAGLSLDETAAAVDRIWEVEALQALGAEAHAVLGSVREAFLSARSKSRR